MWAVITEVLLVLFVIQLRKCFRWLHEFSKFVAKGELDADVATCDHSYPDLCAVPTSKLRSDVCTKQWATKNAK